MVLARGSAPERAAAGSRFVAGNGATPVSGSVPQVADADRLRVFLPVLLRPRLAWDGGAPPLDRRALPLFVGTVAG